MQGRIEEGTTKAMIYTLFECPKCHIHVPAGAWNSETQKMAAEQKKKFLKKIQFAGTTNRLSYRCPECKTVSSKNNITGIQRIQL